MARWHLIVARRLAFWNGDLRTIYQDFHTPLKTHVEFLVLSARGEEIHYDSNSPPATVAVDDKFAFKTHASAPVFVYVYRFDHPIAVRLHPGDVDDIAPQKAAVLPGKGQWLPPPRMRGAMVLTVVLARWRCRDLEELTALAAVQQRIAIRDRSGSPAQVQRMRLTLVPGK